MTNADRFKSLAEEVLKLRNEGFDLSLDHVPREKNREADALAKKGAAFISPSINLKSTSNASAKSGKPMTQAAKASQKYQCQS